MEGLNLEDLNFDTDSLQLFDDEGNLEASASPEAKEGDTPPSAGSELINAVINYLIHCLHTHYFMNS